ATRTWQGTTTNRRASSGSGCGPRWGSATKATGTASRARRFAGTPPRAAMGRVIFFLSEAFRALRRSAAPSLAAIVTVVLTTLLIGVFVPVIKASSTTTENVRSQLDLQVFMVLDATRKQVKAAQHKINRIPHVAGTEYVS